MPAADLARERYVSLATFRRNGAEVRTPIWFAMVDERLVMVTGGDSGKVKRLRNNARVRIAACDARGAVHGPWHEAAARIMTEPREIAPAAGNVLGGVTDAAGRGLQGRHHARGDAARLVE